jgi:4-amino-4-deoxy-L-arabinose transferase-like glycosyltransferase
MSTLWSRAAALLGKTLRSEERRIYVILPWLFALAVFVALFRLTVPTLNPDEPIYREAGAAYVRGEFHRNLEHPFVSKLVIGAFTALFGNGILAARLPGALLGLATGFVLYRIGKRLAGASCGLVCAGFWWLFPQGDNVRIDRFGLLEGPTFFLAALASLAILKWVEAPRWRLAVAAGVVAGLAVSAKYPAALLFGSALLVLVSHGPTLAKRLGQLAAFGAAMAVGFLAPYVAALGARSFDAIRYAVTFQARHVDVGHRQVVDGFVYAHPPWWAHFRWQEAYLGVVPIMALWVAALLPAMALRSRATRPAAAYVLATLLPPVVITSLSPLKLPHYHVLWYLPLSIAVAFGLAVAWRSGGWSRRLGAACAGCLLTCIAGQVRRVATLTPSDYVVAAQLLRDRGVSQATAIVYGYPGVFGAYVPEMHVIRRIDPRRPPAVVLVDPLISDRFPRPDVSSFLEDHGFLYDETLVDRLRLYVRKGASLGRSDEQVGHSSGAGGRKARRHDGRP